MNTNSTKNIQKRIDYLRVRLLNGVTVGFKRSIAQTETKKTKVAREKRPHSENEKNRIEKEIQRLTGVLSSRIVVWKSHIRTPLEKINRLNLNIPYVKKVHGEIGYRAT